MTTLVLLGQNISDAPGRRESVLLQDDTLTARLQRAEQIYNKVLKDRQGLIQKFGPLPSDVVS